MLKVEALQIRSQKWFHKRSQYGKSLSSFKQRSASGAEDSLRIAVKVPGKGGKVYEALQHEVCRAKKAITIVQGDDNLEEVSSSLGSVTDYVNTATLEEMRDDSWKVVLKARQILKIGTGADVTVQPERVYSERFSGGLDRSDKCLGGLSQNL